MISWSKKIAFLISFPTLKTVPLEIKGWVGFMCIWRFEQIWLASQTMCLLWMMIYAMVVELVSLFAQ